MFYYKYWSNSVAPTLLKAEKIIMRKIKKRVKKNKSGIKETDKEEERKGR